MSREIVCKNIHYILEKLQHKASREHVLYCNSLSVVLWKKTVSSSVWNWQCHFVERIKKQFKRYHNSLSPHFKNDPSFEQTWNWKCFLIILHEIFVISLVGNNNMNRVQVAKLTPFKIKNNIFYFLFQSIDWCLYGCCNRWIFLTYNFL